jgi:hypothetical protein
MYEEGTPYREVCVYTDFEFSKVTLVAVQAFPDLRIGEGDSVGLTAAGVRRSGWDTVPVADNDPKWDGPGAAKRVAAWAGIDQADAPASAWDKYARAFLWQDPDADPETVGAYKLGVADVVDGELRLIPRGVYAVAGVLNGARGGADIPAADQDALKKVVSGLYGRIAKAMGDDTIEAPFSLVASVVAPEVPPAAWFADPQLTELTPLTITDDGRVFGHAADWEQIHVGIPGQKPPRSRTGYANFMVGATLTDEGVYATGNLTVGGGHADERLGYAAAAEHYDDAGTAVATVTAGEDQFGIWVAGAIIPEATPGQIRALRRSPLSGDWRYIGGNLEAIAFHAVNTPGFPWCGPGRWWRMATCTPSWRVLRRRVARRGRSTSPSWRRSCGRSSRPPTRSRRFLPLAAVRACVRSGAGRCGPAGGVRGGGGGVADDQCHGRWRGPAAV